MKNNYFKAIVFFALFLVIGIFSFSPIYFPPGLTNPEPVAKFLNEKFPDILTDSNPYAPAFPKIIFNDPLTFEPIPNSTKLLVGQINGEIYWFENDENATQKTLLRDLSNEVGQVFDGGFLGLAANPNFGQEGFNYIYAYYNGIYGNEVESLDASAGFLCENEQYAATGHYMILRRIEVDPVTFQSNPANDLIMMRTKMYGWTHWGGGMKFGLDGFLYIPTGENTGFKRAQEIDDNLYGGVLRIDVDMDASKSHPPIKKMPHLAEYPDEISGAGYYIPNDNPFLSPDGLNFEEYFSIGHRNPHRLSVDRLTGEIYVGEVGGGLHEEINVVEKGKNYGWPVMEGLVTGPGSTCTEIFNGMEITSPLTAFTRDDSNAIIGGFVYRGEAMPEYYGKYICGNWGGGNRVWSIDTSTGEYNQIFSFLPGDLWGFGEDNEGEIYILKRGETNLYKIKPNNSTGDVDFPQYLSQTGAFKNLETLEPSDGVIPYELIEPFWSDGAEKQRWMVIPNDGTHNTYEERIAFSENDIWNFPVGTVLIKHFEIGTDENNPETKKRLETRFTVKTSNGNFYYLTYKWNSEGTDAELLNSEFEEDIVINLANGDTRIQTWSYPDRDDCRTCHSSTKNNTLGPRTRYLNSDLIYPKTNVTANQLVTLSHLGIIDESIDDNRVSNFLTFSAKDSNASLEERARSYLDLNCAYCHSPGGVAERAGVDMSLTKSLYDTGLLDKMIVPGNPTASELIVRMNSTVPGYGMPPLAKNIVDQEGVDLISEWISSLDIYNYGIKGIEISPGTATVNVNESIQLTSNVLPDDVVVNEEVSWSSSNELIATVNQNGLVNALLPGDVQIFAETYEAGYLGSSEITVTNFDGSATDCLNELTNENSLIGFQTQNLTAGGDLIQGTNTTTLNSSCAVEIINSDVNQPWSRYIARLSLADNGIVAGDGLYIALDVEGSNGNGRFEVNAVDNNNSNLALSTFGNGWSNFEQTIVVPENIEAIDFLFYTNYNDNSVGSIIVDNLIIVNIGEIIDNEPPVISLIGANSQELTELDEYIEPGFVANDDIDGDITDSVIVGGDIVNTTVPGTYVVTYNVSDDAGNAAIELTRTIYVVSIFDSCTNYLPNEHPSIILPRGGLTSGCDDVAGITSNTFNSDCAFEISNYDENQPWSRYNIPIDLNKFSISPGDEILIEIDAFSENGAGRISVAQDNTPNTVLTSANFQGDWSSFSDTIIVPSGISTLNIWLYTNYASNSPGQVIFDNLNVVNLSNLPCGNVDYTTYYADLDGDGFGDLNNSIEACDQPVGYVLNNEDCNDDNSEINPNGTENCDGLDNNCNNQIDENLVDCNAPDNIAPVITLLGDNPLNLFVGDNFEEPGFIANDNIDGDITSQVIIAGDTVDTSTANTFSITYNVSDSSGNFAQEVQRTVIIAEIVSCPDNFENESDSVILSTGQLSSGADTIEGISSITNNSSCAIEILNFDSDQPWARYNIPIILAENNLQEGDEILISIDGYSLNGNGRVEIAYDNIPNSAVYSFNFQGTWSNYTETFSIPQGISTFNIWLFANYNSNSSGSAVYDNLEVRKVSDLPCGDSNYTTYYLDEDGDGYGDINNFIEACSQPEGYVLDNSDCNDSNSDIYPGSTVPCEDLDDDNDGVPNSIDLCPNTQQGVNVDFSGCPYFTLPSNNFTVFSTSVSCVGENDGAIQITANENLPYILNISSEGINSTFNFTSEYSLDNLTPGTYNMCISVENENNYEQCFEVEITEPDSITVTSKTDFSSKEVTLLLAGSKSYTIKVNDEIFRTNESEFVVSLTDIENSITVTGDKACQGSYYETVILSDSFVTYPNPVGQEQLTVYVGSTNEFSSLKTVLYDIGGTRVFVDELEILNGYLRLDMSSYPSGTYILVLFNQNLLYSKKITKK